MKIKDLNLYRKIIHAFFSSEKYKNFKPTMILLKKEDSKYKVIIEAVNQKCLDEMICYKTDENICCSLNINDQISEISSWQWNIDTDFFARLENGYKIDFMDIATHYGLWCIIEELGINGIMYKDGLNNYIRFCMNNGISAQLIKSTLGHHVKDIYQLYHEMNNNYEIICKSECADNVIVLTYNKKATKPYATCEMTKSSGYGYDRGHYFSNYHLAYKDFMSRFNDILDSHLNVDKNRNQPKENKEHER